MSADSAILEAAARALLEVEAVEDAGLDQDELARRVVAAVTPLIEAKLIEKHKRSLEGWINADVLEELLSPDIALKEQP